MFLPRVWITRAKNEPSGLLEAKRGAEDEWSAGTSVLEGSGAGALRQHHAAMRIAPRESPVEDLCGAPLLDRGSDTGSLGRGIGGLELAARPRRDLSPLPRGSADVADGAERRPRRLHRAVRVERREGRPL